MKERNPDNRTYLETWELRWDTSFGATASSLRLNIATRSHETPENVVIAKHFPDDFTWKILTDDIAQQVGI